MRYCTHPQHGHNTECLKRNNRHHVGRIPGTQGWVSQCNPSHIPTDGQESGKNLTPNGGKNSQQLGIKGNFFSLVRSTYKKGTPAINLMVKT